jgi:hypothetical protein
MTYEVEEACESHHEKRCYNGDVYWYDSCGNREDRADYCGYSYCDTGGDVYRYCSGGDVWGVYDYRDRGCSGGSCDADWDYNSCGYEELENCGSDEICSGGQCVSDCTSHDYQSCYGGDVYWYDSCGNREDRADYCGYSYCDTGGDVHRYCSGDEVWGVYDYRDRGCSGGSCDADWDYNSCDATELKDCTRNSTDCGYLSCGEGERPSWYCSNGDCEYTCNTSSTCCAPEDHKACHNGDVYWYDSCNNRGSLAESCTIDEDCVSGSCVCAEDCASKGYECGTYNFCGTSISCGTCDASDKTCESGSCEPIEPDMTLEATPEPVRQSEGETTITWNASSTADSCEVTGPQDFHETGRSGSATATIKGASTFTLTCTNYDEEFSTSTTVELIPAYEEF